MKPRLRKPDELLALRVPWSTLVTSVVLTLPLACSGAGGSAAPDPMGAQLPGSSSASAGSTPPAGAVTGAPSTPEVSVALDQGGGFMAAEAGEVPAECASVDQLARLTPVNLIIVYDSSGSMGDSETSGVFNLERRWNPARAGLAGFFEQPGSPGIRASLKFFPHRGGFDVTCNPDNYARPDVSLRDLDDASGFLAALDAREPSGGTPMLPALMGAMQYAERVIAEEPSSRTVVVLVTDGEPAVIPEGGSTIDDVDPNCPAGGVLQNTVGGVSDFVGSCFTGEPSVPTYVIGIGDSVSELGQIAASGGTEMVFIDDASPETTQAELRAALDAIRVVNFDCSIDFPELPVGESISSVNVDFLRSNGEVFPLEKAVSGCSAAGWTLDDEMAPTKIQLCPQACEQIQTDPDGQLSLAIGCATRIR